MLAIAALAAIGPKANVRAASTSSLGSGPTTPHGAQNSGWVTRGRGERELGALLGGEEHLDVQRNLLAEWWVLARRSLARHDANPSRHPEPVLKGLLCDNSCGWPPV